MTAGHNALRGSGPGETTERNLIVVIPGRDRGQAVVLADHYDTAYMEDRYELGRGGDGARLAAAGADDDHSATATMMLGAPIFLELSRNGQLACDIWLVHLTGESFRPIALARAISGTSWLGSILRANSDRSCSDGAPMPRMG